MYSKSSQGIFSRIQNKILRYRFSKKFFDSSLNNNKPYCGQSSHFLITRKTFNKVGGFNPYLRIREDNDFCIRATAMGAKHYLDENFEADHLKFFSLYSDYFEKPFHATKVKALEPNIFNKPSSQIGFSLLMSWIVLPISLLITSLLFFLNLIPPNYYLLINLVSLIVSYIFIPKAIQNELSFTEKIYPCKKKSNF